jgi:hypothetical protein
LAPRGTHVPQLVLDVLACLRCGGRFALIQVFMVIARVLRHLGLSIDILETSCPSVTAAPCR